LSVNEFIAESALTISGRNIRESNGTWAKFGLGNAKGVETDWVVRHGWSPYEVFWALPVQMGDAISKDTVNVVRDANLQVTSVVHNRDSRSVNIARDGSGNEVVQVLDGATPLLSTRYAMTNHRFDDAHGKGAFTVPMVGSISHQKSSTEWLTTTLAYKDGNLAEVDYPNGSVVTYNFTPASRASVLDGACLSKTVTSKLSTERWIYTFNGLGAQGNTDLSPIQNTIVKHELTQPNFDGTLLTSATQTQHTYKLVFFGTNINRDVPVQMDGIKGTDSATLKTIEYRSGRLQLLSSTEGIGTSGRTEFYSYQGDLRATQGKAITTDSRFVDPDYTTWSYDGMGYPVLEKRNVTEDLQKWRANAMLRSAGVLDSIAKDTAYVHRMDTSAAGIATFKATSKSSLGFDLDTLALRAEDAVTVKQYVHRTGGVFFTQIYDTSKTNGKPDSVKVHRAVNAGFDMNSLYKLGFPYAEISMRLVSSYPDSLLSGLYGELSRSDSLLRTIKRYLYVNKDTTLAEETRYAKDSGAFATLPSLRLNYSDATHWAATRFRYDRFGQPTATVHYRDWNVMDGNNVLVDSTEWDALGHKTRQCDPSGACTVFDYDLLGRVVKETRADGSVRSIAFHDSPDANGYTGFTETEPAGDTVRAFFDGLGHLARTVHGGGGAIDVRKTLYGIFGSALAARDSSGRETQYGYDAIGRLANVQVRKDSSSLWLTRRYSYDDLRGTYTETDEDGNQTQFTQNKAGQDIDVRRGTDLAHPAYLAKNQYDNQGHLIWSLDPNGFESYHRWDVQGRLMEERTPEGIDEHYSYDLMHNLQGTTVKGAGGTDSLYRNTDALGRELSQVTLRNGTPIGGQVSTWDSRTGYSRTGSLVGLARSVQYGNDSAVLNEQLTYDVMGRPTNVHRTNGLNASTAYDASLGYSYSTDGLLSSMTIPGGTSMSWGFDGLRRPVHNSLHNGADSVVFVNDVQRDMSGLTSSLTFGNGTQLRYAYETGRPLVKVSPTEFSSYVQPNSFVLILVVNSVDSRDKSVFWRAIFCPRLNSRHTSSQIHLS